MLVVGLTGSIGMGKSTAARMFADAGVPVFDSDATAHLLYAPGGAAARAIAKAFPTVMTEEGGVDRTALRAIVQHDAKAFAQLEALVHPLIARRRRAFLRRATRQGADVAVLDVPLLFETGGDKRVDAIVVVSAPEDVQRARVLARPGMTEKTFETLLARQVPDSVKRSKADYVIDSSRSFPDMRLQVSRILRSLRRRAAWSGRASRAG